MTLWVLTNSAKVPIPVLEEYDVAFPGQLSIISTPKVVRSDDTNRGPEHERNETNGHFSAVNFFHVHVCEEFPPLFIAPCIKIFLEQRLKIHD